MIGSLGFTEIAFILVLALLIFGPKRLPEIGRMVGKGLGEFRRASNDLKRTFNAELSLADDEERPKISRAPRTETKAANEDPAVDLAPESVAQNTVSRETVSRDTGSSTPEPASVADEAGDDRAKEDGATEAIESALTKA